MDLDNIVMTSHLGASTREAEEKTSREIAEVIIGFLLEGNYKNAVNVKETVQAEEKAIYTLMIYHEDIKNLFAQVAAVLGNNNINIRETEIQCNFYYNSCNGKA